MKNNSIPKEVLVKDIAIANDRPFVLIAGPCQIESKDHAEYSAGFLQETCAALNIPLIYKSSFDKANRSSISTKRGVGLDVGLDIFEHIKKTFDLPVITDVHEASQCEDVASVVDVLQIPAFLSRQTDLLLAAAKTGAAINVKKGQFMAPWDMVHVADKIASTGNSKIMLCDRGTSFGYNTLVSDFRGIPIMGGTGYPVIFDATHSVQQPGGNGTTSGGQREFVSTLATAASAIGVAGLFIEAHEDPDSAPSDGPNMVPFTELKALLERLSAFDRLAKG